ncbi:MAG: hypothetical protein EXS51_00070 [Candidatus Taylorbacteria bacterium]|nr:hypothetical protein [Candidatus Taylorbacteria bacterium]
MADDEYTYFCTRYLENDAIIADTEFPLSDEVKAALNLSAKKLDLSARSYHRLIKLARTVADLEGHDEITTGDLMEALQYRPKQLQNS